MLNENVVAGVRPTRSEAVDNDPLVRRINGAALFDDGGTDAALSVSMSSADPVILLDSADPVILLDPADAAPVASAPEMHLSSPLSRLISLGARAPRSPWLEQLSSAAKRMSDVFIASALIVISLPVLVAAAAAIRMTSRGPIFYRQERCGYKGRMFRVIKFRSMVSDADELIPEMTQLAEAAGLKTTDAPMFKSANDPRVTRVGRMLRRTGIDELPQLVNVVAGDMSLVGPRPLVQEEAATLAPLAAERRNSVRPGLTCFWQVLREEETTFAERMQLDLLYVNHRSLVLDLSLIALTPIAIAGGNGSY